MRKLFAFALVTAIGLLAARPRASTVTIGPSRSPIPLLMTAALIGPSYDEGSWTPLLTGDGGGSGQIYSIQSGHYVKIGKLVKLNFSIALTAKGIITGNVVIAGLPYPSLPAPQGADVGAIIWVALVSTWVNVIASVGPGSTTSIYLGGTTVAQTSNNSSLSTVDIGNTSQFRGAIAYFTP
jgi:hypothetical protein